MAAEENFIVAIELGSTNVTGIAGRKQPDGALQVLACVQEPSSAFIRKGRINNIIKMKSCIETVKERLEKTLKRNINRVYVGIGGMGMHTVQNTVVKNFPDKQIVTGGQVDEIIDENAGSQPADKVILKAIIQEYKLGAQTQMDPIGIPSESIEGRFLNIITKREVRENIENCFSQCGLDVVDMPITALALADEMVPEPKRHSGCVFVDMGAETTSVAVYKNNILRHFAVIPLGGKNITDDLASLSIDESEAERIKKKYGKAFFDPTDEHVASIVLDSGGSIPFEEFSGLVEARQEEIIKNVKRQIELSKYDKNQLIGGILLTGGAAKMEGIKVAVEKYTGFGSDKIQTIATIPTILRQSIPNFNKDGNCNAAIAILNKGEENCAGGPLGSDGEDMFARNEREKKERERQAALERERAEKEAADRAQKEAEEAEQRAREEEERARQEAKKAKKEKRRAFWRTLGQKIKEKANDLVSDVDNSDDEKK